MATRAGASVDLYEADGNLRKLSDIEADIIDLAMTLYDGCVTKAARRLRIGRSTLYRKLERNEDLSRRAIGPTPRPL